MSEFAERYFTKALTAIRQHDYERAEALLVEAIKHKPDFVEAHVVRGNCLHAMDRPYDAILNYERALSFNDSAHDAWNNRGMAFADLGLWQMAELSFRRSSALLPAMEPHIGLANMYCTLMRLPEAAREYRKAIEFGAGPDIHFNLGVTLLGMGEWEEGFKEYEARWDNTPYPPGAYRNYPKWRGEDLTGSSIRLYGEQGYGDEIMALRFVDLLVEKYHPLIYVETRSPLMRLVERKYRGSRTVIPCEADYPAMTNFSSPLLDVPMMLGLIPGNVTTGRYLEADMMAAHEWGKRFKPGLNVGLCWTSGGHLETAKAAQGSKSIPLPWLKPLAIDGVNLISLQKGAPFPGNPGFEVTDWTNELHDFADTAALIEALDLVITVDTAVAHLAGALGKPVWNFVRYSGYWPWLTPEAAGSETGSIWYPSMSLLRQPRLADWNEPIAVAADMLKAKVA